MGVPHPIWRDRPIMKQNIRVERIEGPFGERWTFYLNGEYRGSAGDKASARNAAKALLDRARRNKERTMQAASRLGDR